MEQVQQPVKRLIRKYYEDKQLYLKPNTKFLLEEIRKDSRLSGLTTRDILILKNTLYELSRIKHYRRQKKGGQEFRNYITFSPGNTSNRALCGSTLSTSPFYHSCTHETNSVMYLALFFFEVPNSLAILAS